MARANAMTSSGPARKTCPVCGTHSVYTNGYSACSLRCAIQVTRQRYREFEVPLDTALAAVSREFEVWGLPKEPAPEDLYRYRYVKVHEKWKSRYWKIDRALLLEAGLNVEYSWVGSGASRSRVYRFSSLALQNLPEVMNDYKVRSFSEDEMNWLLAWWEPYWHFLPAPEKS